MPRLSQITRRQMAATAAIVTHPARARKITALALAAWAPAALAQAAVPQVVADIPAVHSLVAQVMGDLGQPVLLMEQGANAHSYQLRPSQARALQQADLLVWIGPEMTPWLERAAASRTGAVLGLLADPVTHRRAYGQSAQDEHDHDQEGHGHDHDHDHDHDQEGHGHDDHAQEAAESHDDHAHGDHDDHDDHDDHAAHDGHEGHDHSGTDPHAWLDPANAAAWLGRIAETLAQADPENGATYRANAQAAAAAITALDGRIAQELAPLTDRPFMVFHDAYGYFAAHYGLAVAGSLALGDAASPGAERLARLRQQLADDQVVCVFPEAAHDPKLIATLVEGSPARLGAPLDPEGSALRPGAALYDGLLDGLAKTLGDCLGQ